MDNVKTIYINLSKDRRIFPNGDIVDANQYTHYGEVSCRDGFFPNGRKTVNIMINTDEGLESLSLALSWDKFKYIDDILSQGHLVKDLPREYEFFDIDEGETVVLYISSPQDDKTQCFVIDNLSLQEIQNFFKKTENTQDINQVVNILKREISSVKEAIIVRAEIDADYRLVEGKKVNAIKYPNYGILTDEKGREVLAFINKHRYMESLNPEEDFWVKKQDEIYADTEQTYRSFLTKCVLEQSRFTKNCPKIPDNIDIGQNETVIIEKFERFDDGDEKTRGCYLVENATNETVKSFCNVINHYSEKGNFIFHYDEVQSLISCPLSNKEELNIEINNEVR